MTTAMPSGGAKGGRKSFLLRINEELWEEMNRWAAQEFRSVNAQIEFILQRAVEERKKRPGGTSGRP